MRLKCHFTCLRYVPSVIMFENKKRFQIKSKVYICYPTDTPSIDFLIYFIKEVDNAGVRGVGLSKDSLRVTQDIIFGLLKEHLQAGTYWIRKPGLI